MPFLSPANYIKALKYIYTALSETPLLGRNTYRDVSSSRHYRLNA